jgi:hypothetical protein
MRECQEEGKYFENPPHPLFQRGDIGERITFLVSPALEVLSIPLSVYRRFRA